MMLFLKYSGLSESGDRPFSPVHNARKLEEASESEKEKILKKVMHFSDVLGAASLNSSKITLRLC
jgi:hypothetical protein